MRGKFFCTSRRALLLYIWKYMFMTNVCRARHVRFHSVVVPDVPKHCVIIQLAHFLQHASVASYVGFCFLIFMRSTVFIASCLYSPLWADLYTYQGGPLPRFALWAAARCNYLLPQIYTRCLYSLSTSSWIRRSCELF
jgi:hypothetical protein